MSISILVILAYIPMLTRWYFLAAKSIGQLQKDLDAARESQRYAESQYEAGCLSSQRNLEEKKCLQAENRQQAKEIESLKTQWAQTQEENQKLQRGMFGKCDYNVEGYLYYMKCNGHALFHA